MSDHLKFDTSGYALLDVTKGRAKLARFFEKNPGASVPVVIVASITGQFGDDDGTSIEFNLKIEDLFEFEPVMP